MYLILLLMMISADIYFMLHSLHSLPAMVVGSVILFVCSFLFGAEIGSALYRD
jgi:hypothetical protein